MNRFIAFVIKEFRHLLRDPRTMIVLFAIPVIQLLLFGYVISTEIKNARIAILDLSKDSMTKEIANKLRATGYFTIEKYLNNTHDIETEFQKGSIKEVIIFLPDFERQLIRDGVAPLQIIADASDPNMASLLDAYSRSVIYDFIEERNHAKGVGVIKTEFRMVYNEQLRSAYLFVPGTMALILMLISALMTSISITREKESGTMEVLLVSPLRPIQIILGKLTPYLALSVANMIAILLIGYFVFKVPINGSLILLAFTCILFILLALSLGVMISTIAKTQQVAMIISLIALMLPTVLLSGFIFPIENMPKALQVLSIFMPPRWFLLALKSVMLKGLGLGYIYKYLLVMILMLSAFIIISVRNFKIRLE
ncbi:MAG: ABC transporter permease [Bacteroidota bacterium]|nr:MAG: ABC transporter permease [Bacteroidota bacterium]